MGIFDFYKISAKVPLAKPELTSEKQLPVELINRDVYNNTSAAGSRLTIGGSIPAGVDDDVRHHVIVKYLSQQQQRMIWLSDDRKPNEGVIVRKNRTDYVCSYPGLMESEFGQAMMNLNVQCAMTINSDVLQPFLGYFAGLADMPLQDGRRIQILPSMSDLMRARKHQYSAFIKDEGLLIVWDDDVNHLVARGQEIENALVATMWTPGQDKKAVQVTTQSCDSDIDAESGAVAVEDRPMVYFNSVQIACSLCLLFILLGLQYAELAVDALVLKSYISLAYLAMTPIIIFFSLFFCTIIVGVLSQLFGPVQQLARNTKFYSAVPSPRLVTTLLPHVTIQCPVYKEGLKAVIEPTVASIQKAITTYELQGGSANIFINDDGLQLLPDAERQARIEFYADYGIAWTARPPHGANGHFRKGKFKKASNMNYGLELSNSVEQKLAAINRPADWTQVQEVSAFDVALKEVLTERPEAWAEGNIRMGDYILIIDSDTQVPEDCLLDAVSEMERSPSVGIIQFSCAVMQVSNNFFENGIAFFTDLVYTSIRYGVANGSVAAFVGHNALLRWSAIQEVSFIDDEGHERFWAEDCVSEDFELALRLQMRGFIIRMAGWAGDGFKEGVSLTVYDELIRWQKYAYGCSELIFNPLRTWIYKSPFTPLFRSFLCSSMDISSKVRIIAYIGSYYALGSAWIFTTANYVFVGEYNGFLDRVYLESWKVWLSVILVFSLAGNVGLALQRHRSGEKSFIPALWECMRWSVMFVVFFGGISVHISQALLCHMLEIPMAWSATSKEVEFSNFFLEVPKILKTFKYTFLMSIFGIVAMIIMAVAPFIPWSYNITEFIAVFPFAFCCACHLLLPIVLNPELMTFSF